MAEYLERETAVMRLMQDGCSAKTYRPSWRFPPLMLKKYQMDTTPSQTCMSKGLFCLPLLLKTIRMHGKASGMRTAAFLSAGDGSSWVLTPMKGVIHTTMN